MILFVGEISLVASEVISTPPTESIRVNRPGRFTNTH